LRKANFVRRSRSAKKRGDAGTKRFLAVVWRRLREGPIVVEGRVVQVYPREPHTELGADVLSGLPLVHRYRVEEDDRRVKLGEGVFQELQPLHGQFDLAQEQAGDPTAGLGKGRHIAALKWIICYREHHDRRRLRGRERRFQANLWTRSQEDVGFAFDDFPVTGFVCRFLGAGCLHVVESDILAFSIAEFRHAPFEGRKRR
jgi:hypothetical protein